MKNILAIGLVFSLTCCADLEEEVFSSASPSNFYQSVEDADAAVISIYNSLNRTVGLFDFGLSSLIVMPSPKMVARVSWRAYWGTYTVTASDAPSLPRSWNGLYQAVFRANVAIAELEGRDFGDDNADRIKFVGEAKFMRAWCYFNLVRLFGEVPMPVSPAGSIESAQLGKSSISDIYGQIVSDLTDAETELPAEARMANELGRPFSTTAKFLLAKVYLTMAGLPLQDAGAMSLANTKIQEVIALENTPQGYQLLASYEDAIRVDDNAERIFAIQQTQAVEDQGTAFSHVWGARAYATGIGQFHGGYSEDFYNEFEPTDTRRDVTMQYTYTDMNGVFRTYGENGFYNKRFGIYQGKYIDNDQSCCDGDPDMGMLRYSDALLMSAEIENSLNGPTTAAYDALNRVRQRAGASDAPAGMSQTEFEDYIYEERFKELSFEFHEVFDMRRLGKVEEALAIHPENVTWAPANTAYQSHFELWPIPLAEVQANPNLVQNDGW